MERVNRELPGTLYMDAHGGVYLMLKDDTQTMEDTRRPWCLVLVQTAWLSNGACVIRYSQSQLNRVRQVTP